MQENRRRLLKTALYPGYDILILIFSRLQIIIWRECGSHFSDLANSSKSIVYYFYEGLLSEQSGKFCSIHPLAAAVALYCKSKCKTDF